MINEDTQPARTVDLVPKAASRLNMATIVLSLIGSAIAGTIWWADKRDVDLPCSADHGCAMVAASKWSHFTIGPFHDIPVSLLGLAGYLAIFTIGMMKAGSEARINALRLSWLGGLIATFGFGYSWFLQYIAYAKIDAFCPWCRASACVMTAIFVLSVVELSVLRRAVATNSSLE